MPKVLDVEGFRFFFFSDERQEPPHLHVEKGNGAAKLWLQPVRIAYNLRPHARRDQAHPRVDPRAPSGLRGAME